MWIKLGNINLGAGSPCAAVTIAMAIAAHYSTAAFTIPAFELRTKTSCAVEQHTDSYALILCKQKAEKNSFKRESSGRVD